MTISGVFAEDVMGNTDQGYEQRVVVPSRRPMDQKPNEESTDDEESGNRTHDDTDVGQTLPVRVGRQPSRRPRLEHRERESATPIGPRPRENTKRRKSRYLPVYGLKGCSRFPQLPLPKGERLAN